MGEFLKDNLPDPVSYFDSEGMTLKGPGSAKWKTTACHFHGGSDSMRVNTQTGAWVCMACAVKGGDVLAHHMQAHGLEFIDAARALGAWQDDGKPNAQHRPTPLSARAAMSMLAVEASLIAYVAGSIHCGVQLTEEDRARVYLAGSRITTINEAFQ